MLEYIYHVPGKAVTKKVGLIGLGSYTKTANEHGAAKFDHHLLPRFPSVCVTSKLGNMCGQVMTALHGKTRNIEYFLLFFLDTAGRSNKIRRSKGQFWLLRGTLFFWVVFSD